jgi:hypothetical protein
VVTTAPGSTAHEWPGASAAYDGKTLAVIGAMRNKMLRPMIDARWRSVLGAGRDNSRRPIRRGSVDVGQDGLNTRAFSASNHEDISCSNAVRSLCVPLVTQWFGVRF